MIDILLSIILYGIFGLLGIHLFKKIDFFKKITNKQNTIYISIFYIVFGFFIGQADQYNTGIAYQIGFGIGNFISAVVGSLLATSISTKKKPDIKSKTFFYSMFGSIPLGCILILLTI